MTGRTQWIQRTGFIGLILSLAGWFCLCHTPVQAASAAKIDSWVDETLADFQREVKGGSALLQKAKGVLILPKVYKAGIGVGGEYGEGALRIGGKTVDYYNIMAASWGFQLGGQKKSIVMIFLDESALRKFRGSSGWKVGVDASVALIKVGMEGEIDTNTIDQPIAAFIIGQKGLMYDLSLEGAKFNKLAK